MLKISNYRTLLLKDGCLLDVSSHILYFPLPCCIPLPGFEKLRFCVSQYEEKDRLLLRNLCFVLGAKFVEKLTRKVTHLLCKFTGGPKYEAACKWGIKSVTSEWIYECVKQVYSCCLTLSLSFLLHVCLCLASSFHVILVPPLRVLCMLYLSLHFNSASWKI